MRARTLGVVAALAALALSGCASPVAGDPDVVVCQDDALERAILDARIPVDDLDAAARDIVAQAQYDDGTPFLADEDWFVGRAGADEVILIRERVADAEDPREHEHVTVSWLDDRWMVTAHGHCDLTVDLGSHTVPDLAIDPASDPQTTNLQVLVTERDCNSGQDATGRVELISLTETDSTVTVVIGVRPQGGTASCPLNPPTPFTVELTTPLGDRPVYDGTRSPARQLTVASPLD